VPVAIDYRLERWAPAYFGDRLLVATLVVGR
jgi:hypothetical protein